MIWFNESLTNKFSPCGGGGAKRRGGGLFQKLCFYSPYSRALSLRTNTTDDKLAVRQPTSAKATVDRRIRVQIPRPWRGGLMERSDIKTGRVFWCIRLAERLVQNFCQPSPPLRGPPRPRRGIESLEFHGSIIRFSECPADKAFPNWDL